MKALQLSVLVEISKRGAQGIRQQDLILDEPKKFGPTCAQNPESNQSKKYGYFAWIENKLIRQEIITSGTANSSLIHPREVFRPAIRHGCSAIILAHNHPSGDYTKCCRCPSYHQE